jgi:hypothetical protein
LAEVNYTVEQTKRIVEAYKAEPTRTTVDLLAKELGKTVKSIIGKLSREKVYIKKDYETKRGEKPITKLEIVANIAEMLKIDASTIEGLVKASKFDVQNLEKAVRELTS